MAHLHVRLCLKPLKQAQFLGRHAARLLGPPRVLHALHQPLLPSALPLLPAAYLLLKE